MIKRPLLKSLRTRLALRIAPWIAGHDAFRRYVGAGGIPATRVAAQHHLMAEWADVMADQHESSLPDLALWYRRHAVMHRVKLEECRQ